MNKKIIYAIFSFLIVFVILNLVFSYTPLIKKDKAYQMFVDETKELLKREVEEITEHKITNGVVYQTPDGHVFGRAQYDDFCIVQDYPEKNAVITKDCRENTYASAKEQIEKYSSKKELISDTKDTGLDPTLPFSSKKYFVGEDPNNYLYYSGGCYRVVGIAQNDTVKVVYEGVANEDKSCTDVSDDNSGMLFLYTWDEKKNRSGNFEVASTLKSSLNRFVEEEMIRTGVITQELDTSVIAPADWYIGKVNENNTLLVEDIQNERSEISETPFAWGLLNNSDYLKVSCKTSGGESSKDCTQNNYLYKSKYQWWTINYGEEKDAWFVNKDGSMKSDTIGYSHEYRFSGVRHSFYLKADTLLTGTGTEEDPYRIVK